MRIVKEEPDDPHSHLKALSEKSETLNSDADEDDIDSLLDDIHIID